MRPTLISAIGTPLNDEEGLHREGLYKHLDEQYAAQIDGILVAGTMGLMKLLADATYYDLVAQSVIRWEGKGEILVGVGDASYARTVDRIRLVNEMRVDGVVVLSPYFVSFTQEELLDYFRSLADISRAPLFLYDLPQRTRTSLEIDTILALSDHPNIAGIKCSGDIEQTRRLIEKVRGSSFRVIVAQPTLLDVLLREGVCEHLDGIYSIAPHLSRQIANEAMRNEWELARSCMTKLTSLLTTIQSYGIFPSMTAILNWRGIPGCFAPRPFRLLSQDDQRQLLEEPAVTQAHQD